MGEREKRKKQISDLKNNREEAIKHIYKLGGINKDTIESYRKREVISEATYLNLLSQN